MLLQSYAEYAIMQSQARETESEARTAKAAAVKPLETALETSQREAERVRKQKNMTNAQSAAMLQALEELHKRTTSDEYIKILREMRETLTATKATEESKKTGDTAKK